jgi:hypothetical protein
MGWPGMLSSSMHWTWKNCPKSWQGLYCGQSKEPTIVLEVVASQDLLIWHSFFGLPGSLNDINFLHRSHLLLRLVKGDAPACSYTVDGREYIMGYYIPTVYTQIGSYL